MKKILLVVLVISLSFLVVGCKKKTTTTQTGGEENPQQVIKDVTQSQTPSQAGTTSLEGTVAQGKTGLSQADASKLQTNLQKHYKEATESANISLKNKAKFCSLLVTFPATASPFVGQQYFFFASDDEKQKDWYWVIEYDELRNPDKQKRFFAAKKDFADIQCIPSPPAAAPDYVTAYSSYIQGGTNTFNSSQLSEIEIYIQSNAWVIKVWSIDGVVMDQQNKAMTAVSGTTSTTSSSTSSSSPTTSGVTSPTTQSTATR